MNQTVLEDTIGSTSVIEIPGWINLAVMIVAVIAILIYLVTQPGELTNDLIGGMLFLGLFFLFIWLLGNPEPFELNPIWEGIPASNGTGGAGSGQGGTNGQSGTAPTIQPPSNILLLIIVFWGILFIAIIFSLRWITDRRDDSERSEEESASAETDIEAIRREAGKAASRIQADANIDNEVYNAWRQMTNLLDIPNPEASTPGEFAAAAIDAGFDRENIERLRTVFEEVRYGGSEPTDDLERQAIEAFREIENSAENP